MLTLRMNWVGEGHCLQMFCFANSDLYACIIGLSGWGGAKAMHGACAGSNLIMHGRDQERGRDRDGHYEGKAPERGAMRGQHNGGLPACL